MDWQQYETWSAFRLQRGSTAVRCACVQCSGLIVRLNPLDAAHSTTRPSSTCMTSLFMLEMNTDMMTDTWLYIHVEQWLVRIRCQLHAPLLRWQWVRDLSALQAALHDDGSDKPMTTVTIVIKAVTHRRLVSLLLNVQRHDATTIQLVWTL